MDIKEAVPAAAPHGSNADIPEDDAVRVVSGGRHLSPALGERMLGARLLDRPVFIRELLPQDLKVEINRLSREEALKAARYLAMTVGKAHAKQMDDSTREKWCVELIGYCSSSLDAPSWLWSSFVALHAKHEAAYLEHCRRYALKTALQT
ncbi:MAG: DUF2252 family protein [Acetobacteraceae bacterium]|nr:DUF2252 family protein [Acetobacteraceae bacterium]